MFMSIDQIHLIDCIVPKYNHKYMLNLTIIYIIEHIQPQYYKTICMQRDEK